jgi:hypothetical protein
MPKYKVCYHGVVYVEADDADEAYDLYDCYVGIYEEKEVTSVEEVDDSELELIL